MATLPPAAKDEVVAAGTVVLAAQPQPLHPWTPGTQEAAPETQRSVEPWLRRGHLTQEFGDVLQRHAAGHRLERWCMVR